MKNIVCSRALPVTTFVVAFLTGATALVNSNAIAEELSQSHINAAKKTISATRATEQLNNILPAAASGLSQRLIANRPDIETEITQVVNETALALAVRRGDLEKEIEKIYARVFSEKELQEIGTFFSTRTGQKFLVKLPVVIDKIHKASRIWGVGINRDLNKKVQEKLVKMDK